MDAATRTLLADAQTSGGLLLCVPREKRDAMATALARRGLVVAAEIGVLEAAVAGEAGQIFID